MHLNSKNFIHVTLCFLNSAFTLYGMNAGVMLDAAKKGDTFNIKRGIYSGLINVKNRSGCTPLLRAIAANQKKAVERLLVGKADVCMPDNEGIFPLELAAYQGDHDLVAKLLAAGAKVEQADMSGRTALFAAVLGRHAQVVRELLEARANPNVSDAIGWTALLWASFFGMEEVAMNLLKKNAQACVQEPLFGTTPLHWAVMHRKLPLVEALVQAGADGTLVDRMQNKSPLQIAKEQNLRDIVTVLEAPLAKEQDIYDLLAVLEARSAPQKHAGPKESTAQIELPNKISAAELARALGVAL